VQLFDLVKDPWEMHDLSGDPALADVKHDLWARMKSFQKELGDPLVLQEA
jgi:N-sulfoglucosamine sulfohydrolase